MSATISKQVYATVMATKVDASSPLPSMTVSTATVDRDMDRVSPEGGDFKAFERNPVLCWAHSPDGLPIGSITHLSADSAGIRMMWKWLENDPLADRVKNAWEQGIVRAASIGFIPKRSVRNEYGGQDHREWELLEVSLVPVPANPTAVRTLKSLGLWGDHGSDRNIEFDWDAIFASATSSGTGLSWADGRPITSEDVEQAAAYLLPAVRDGVRAGLGVVAREAAQRAINHMTGRLD
jgi:HK97 family phage prohead protease